MFIFLNKYIAWVWITVDIAQLEDHLSVHLADLGRDRVRVDPVTGEVVEVIDVTA